MKISADFIKDWRHKYVATQLGVSESESAAIVLRLWSHLQDKRTDTLEEDNTILACICEVSIEQGDLLAEALLKTWIELTEDGYWARSFRETNTKMFNAWLSGSKGGAPSKRGAPDEAQKVADAWNAMAKKNGLPVIRMIGDTRRRKINNRLKQEFFKENLEEILGIVSGSAFLKGQMNNGQGWKATFDWFIRSDEIPVKIFEGTYGGVELEEPEKAEVFIYLSGEGKPKSVRLSNSEARMEYIKAHSLTKNGTGVWQEPSNG